MRDKLVALLRIDMRKILGQAFDEAQTVDERKGPGMAKIEDGSRRELSEDSQPSSRLFQKNNHEEWHVFQGTAGEQTEQHCWRTMFNPSAGGLLQRLSYERRRGRI